MSDKTVLLIIWALAWLGDAAMCYTEDLWAAFILCGISILAIFAFVRNPIPQETERRKV